MASAEFFKGVKDLFQKGTSTSQEGAIGKVIEGASKGEKDTLLRVDAEAEQLIVKEKSEKIAREKNPEKFKERDAAWKDKANVVKLVQKQAAEVLQRIDAQQFQAEMMRNGEGVSGIFVDRQTEEFFRQSGIERTMENEYAARRVFWDAVVGEYVKDVDTGVRGDPDWTETKGWATVYRDGVPHTTKYLVEEVVAEQSGKMDEIIETLKAVSPTVAIIAAEIAEAIVEKLPIKVPTQEPIKETKEVSKDTRTLEEVVMIIEEIKESFEQGPLGAEEKAELKAAKARRDVLMKEAKEKGYITEVTKINIRNFEKAAVISNENGKQIDNVTKKVTRPDPIENVMEDLEIFSAGEDQKLKTEDKHLAGYMEVYTALVRPTLELAKAEKLYERTKTSEARQEKERLRNRYNIEKFGAIKTSETVAVINKIAEASAEREIEIQKAGGEGRSLMEMMAGSGMGPEGMGGFRYKIEIQNAVEADNLIFSREFVETHGLPTELYGQPTIGESGGYIIEAVSMAGLLDEYLNTGERPQELSWQYIYHTLKMKHRKDVGTLTGEVKLQKLKENSNELKKYREDWQRFEHGVLPFIDAYYGLKKGYLADFGSNPSKNIPSHLAKMNINDVVAGWIDDDKAKRILGMMEIADGRDVGLMSVTDKKFAQKYQAEFLKMRTTSQKKFGYLHKDNLANMIAAAEDMTKHVGYDKGVAKMMYTFYTILGGIQGIKDSREFWIDYGDVLTKDPNDAMMYHKIFKFKHGDDAPAVEGKVKNWNIQERTGDVEISLVDEEKNTTKVIVRPGDIIKDENGVRRVLLGEERTRFDGEEGKKVERRYRVLTKEETEWAKTCIEWHDGEKSISFGWTTKQMAFYGVDGLLNGLLKFADPYGWWKYYLGDEMVLQNGMKKLKELKDNMTTKADYQSKFNTAIELILPMVTGDPPSISIKTAENILNWMDIDPGRGKVAMIFEKAREQKQKEDARLSQELIKEAFASYK